MIKGYHDLIVHRKADQLALLIYQIVADYPRDEQIVLANQMRRAAVSIPGNIAEGYARSGHKDRLRFFNIAQGSLAKLTYFTEFSLKIGYLDQRTYVRLMQQSEVVGKLLNSFINLVEKDSKINIR